MRKTKKQKNLKKPNISICIKIIIFSSMLILGLVLISISYRVTGEIEYKTYKFGVDMNLEEENITKYLKNFLWQHNFSQKRGEISFDINFQDKIDYIYFTIPSLIELDEIILKECVKDKDSPYSCIEIEPSVKIYKSNNYNTLYTTIDLEDFQSNSNRHRFIISYKSKLEPNGVFRLSINSDTIRNARHVIEFNIGSDYSCKNGCLDFDYGRGIVPSPYNEYKNIKLKIDETNEDISPLIFRLQTVDNNKQFSKFLLESLGVSIFVSAMFLLLSFMMNLKFYDNSN